LNLIQNAKDTKEIKKTEKKKKKERNKNIKRTPGNGSAQKENRPTAHFPANPNRYLAISLSPADSGTHWSDPPSTPSRFFLH
jgi:hypothetical protein